MPAGEGWLSPANVIAMAAALVSLISAMAAIWAGVVAHRSLRRMNQADFPVLSCRIGERLGHWVTLRLTLENASQTTWQVERVKVPWPNRALIANMNEASKRDAVNSQIPDMTIADVNAKKETQLYLEAGPLGSAAPAWTGRSRGNVGFNILFAKPNGGSRIKADFYLVSSEPTPRTMCVRVVRRLTA